MEKTLKANKITKYASGIQVVTQVFQNVLSDFSYLCIFAKNSFFLTCLSNWGLITKSQIREIGSKKSDQAPRKRKGNSFPAKLAVLISYTVHVWHIDCGSLLLGTYVCIHCVHLCNYSFLSNLIFSSRDEPTVLFPVHVYFILTAAELIKSSDHRFGWDQLHW